MAVKTDEITDSDDSLDIHRFTWDFFQLFGATVKSVDQQRHGALHVALTADLATHFGKDKLLLAFQHVDAGCDQELVAYGSRVFDQMMAWLDRRGALTVLDLPARFPASDRLLSAVHPVNATVAGLHMSEEVHRILAFNWHITYRADDKREEIFTVALDENGARLRLHNEPGADERALDLTALLALAAPAPATEDGEMGPAHDGSPHDTPQKTPSQSAGPHSAKLPPMTHLARWAETARKYAIYHADTRCAAHEADILPRLHKVLTRLTTYYEQQINEIYDAHDPEGEKRRILEADLRRKIDEEVENHRLRVRVNLSSYAILHLPVAVAELTLSADEQDIRVRVLYNRFDGSMTRPRCHACGEETTDVAIDRNGHVTCDACLHQCETCVDFLCDACGVAVCPVCAAENCENCGQFCWACGERACPDHVSLCPVCGDIVCHACQTACAACGVRQCRTHLRLDAVAIEHGETELICHDCAIRCPGCQQYTTHVGLCSASGQRFCESCLVTCSVCNRAVGAGFYARNPVTNAPICESCLTHCPACGEITFEELACTVCGEACCPACNSVCDVCGGVLCNDHALLMEGCGHHICATHLAECKMDGCTVMGEALCPLCHDPCAICGEYHCDEHSIRCAQCQRIYCPDCINESELCATCASIGDHGVDVQLTAEPWVDDPDVAELAPHYNWRRVENRRYIIYLGRGALMSTAHVTVKKTPTGGEVLDARLLDLQDMLRANFWRAGKGPGHE